MDVSHDGKSTDKERPRARGHRTTHGEALLDRAFRMLTCFGPDTPVLSLSSLATRADLPKATALRLVRQLVDQAALERTPSGHYTIGLRLLEIASLAPRGHGLRALALPYMQDLWHATRQHVQLVVREGLQCVLVERLSARDSTRIPYRVGGRMPLHFTAPGLVLLAFAPTEVQEEFHAIEWPDDEEGLTNTGDALRARLAAIRRDRFAVLSRPLWGVPTSGVATPILDRNSTTIAALSVVTPSEQIQPAAHVPAMVVAARAITRVVATELTWETLQ
ncbi:IclR family transcriptional regulator [Streptomyces sp. HNM0663]|uniref:IclR family transcriptional regulator n=1 Tax=Streptomyces chengmaiensis TaxID=3040919 RepID=A0ABT6HR47_9ACTN|nr:IclR family transcriptional regulator [Streptomyces chengmaiensis]MDH2391196.1 IclR family transcriptional regulator [Streptomyces chengmaiensis]